MPAHRKYFNLPDFKTCPECGADFPRPAGYGHDRWHKAEVCSLSCASRRGNRNRAAKRTAEFAAIFDEQVDKTPGQGPNGDCWEWKGLRFDTGYGRIGYQNRSLYANRVALFGIDGYDNPLQTCHKCDNPPCVRPDHLFPGTAKVNALDKVAKGRHRGNERLSPDEVRAIMADPRPQSEIALAFGVSQSTVSLIKRGETWKGLR